MKQPNPRFRRPEDLPRLHREHYEVAKLLGGPFEASQFKSQYRQLFPDRTPGSILPSDYCFNRENRGNSLHPRFLLWNGGFSYRFVDLDGPSGPNSVPPSKPGDVSIPLAVPRPGFRRAEKRFLVPPSASLSLNAEEVRAAIHGFNVHDVVQRQEEAAYRALGSGFARGRVAEQLRILSRAYSTRTHGSDILIIADAIERDWDRWVALLAAAPNLAHQVAPVRLTRELLVYFLDQGTQRRPRSLATKALHFAAPQSYAPVDAYAVNTLGKELNLRSGAYTATEGLDSADMARWYTGYLEVIHLIGRKNQRLLDELMILDSQEGVARHFKRVCGLPKIIDKILWWRGRPSAGLPTKLFV
jgi:hypothetical protein